MSLKHAVSIWDRPEEVQSNLIEPESRRAQMREADKGRSGKRKGRGDTAADDADPLQEAGGKRYFKKKY